MKTLIHLKIEKLHEAGQDYYLATSEDVQGLVAEGQTIEEVIEIASDLAKILLELHQQNEQPPALPNTFQYPLILEV
ncbi:type II toxin-antitoxin system HicB family antitoxin [Picosynechococcus sp. PCC 7117]|uniref:type II toxin-antitoxin system HicB family antitoxin n=1 Tax=Picosynechococcus sp. PCC 7117 TaxID=195498 RepID=UPI000810E870|nr:DUF1902 domain-containing protein [Picosynechococcus sp. PCC 7117]ANV87515.1 DUF1902 domain-containing protein [Picosynechococcus sp. PCC 7117]